MEAIVTGTHLNSSSTGHTSVHKAVVSKPNLSVQKSAIPAGVLESPPLYQTDTAVDSTAFSPSPKPPVDEWTKPHRGRCRGQGWTCPKCNSIRRQKLMDDARAAILLHPRYHYRYKATFTIPHDGLSPVEADRRLRDAWERFQRGVNIHYARLATDVQFIKLVGMHLDGHPHLHVLLVSTTPLDESWVERYWCSLTGAAEIAVQFLRLNTSRDAMAWLSYMIHGDFRPDSGLRYTHAVWSRRPR